MIQVHSYFRQKININMVNFLLLQSKSFSYLLIVLFVRFNLGEAYKGLEGFSFLDFIYFILNFKLNSPIFESEFQVQLYLANPWTERVSRKNSKKDEEF
jgi:hypothetical protein